jgi:head-tail adaptor
MALKRGRELQAKQITMQRQGSREPGGGQDYAWVDVWTRPGRLVPATAADVQRLSSTDETVTGRLIFGEDPEATAANRFRIGKRFFRFRGVMDPSETGRFWIVYVEESGMVSRNPVNPGG